jgi:hypothetical protein
MTRELVGNIVEQAIKVTSFRKVIREACRKENIPYPCDDMVAEYIEEGNPFDVNKFMDDYKSQFKTPMEKFMEKVKEIDWSYMPSDDEIVSFFNMNGDNVSLFIRQQNVKYMPSLERKIYLKTIGTLSVEKLATLWNEFIKESALYGEDSYIYDLENVDECKFLGVHMKSGEFNEILMLAANGTRFVQWFAHNNGNIAHLTEEDIKNTLSTFWTEIFERIMVYPSAYNFKIGLCEGDGSTYFDDIFFPIIAEQVGYIIDVNKGTIKKVEK